MLKLQIALKGLNYHKMLSPDLQMMLSLDMITYLSLIKKELYGVGDLTVQMININTRQSRSTILKITIS
jgi:hypothetical protein